MPPGANMPHTVSVVIPCYGQAAFLGDAIESVLRQTHRAVEIVVVNDGSPDDTAAVAAMYPGVTYLEQANAGAAVARNTGMRASSGAHLIFLDADDRLLPTAADAGLASLAAHPDWAFVTGHVRIILRDGSPGGTPAQDHQTDDPYLQLLRSNYVWSPGAVLYRRSALEAVGGFDPSAGGSADYELNTRLAERFPFGCHHEVVLEYRQHDASMSGDAAYMLRSAVSVRRSQLRRARAHPRVREALRAGIATVQADFGERLVRQIQRDLGEGGRRGHAFRALLCLARYHPAGLRQLAALSLRRLVAGPR